MAAKRADYFAAGTAVVWDVDTVAELIHVYRADAPSRMRPTAEARSPRPSPPSPGWRPDVDAILSITPGPLKNPGP